MGVLSAPVTSGDSQDGDTDTLELINTEVTARLTRLTEAGKGIDTKAGVLAGFAATAAQFLAGRDAQPLLQGLGLGAYALAFLFAVWALAVATYLDVPDPRELVNTYARRPKAIALADLVVERVNAIESNAKKHEAKARRWWIALGWLAVGLVLSIAAIVQTDDRDPGPGQGRSPAGGGAGLTASGGGA